MVNKLFSPQLEYILSLFYLNHLCNETLLRIIWHAKMSVMENKIVDEHYNANLCGDIC